MWSGRNPAVGGERSAGDPAPGVVESVADLCICPIDGSRALAAWNRRWKGRAGQARNELDAPTATRRPTAMFPSGQAR